MRKTLLSTLLLVLVSVMTYAGVVNDSIYVLNEDFESGVLPEGWTQEFVSSDIYGEHPWAIETAEEADYPKALKENGNYLLALRNNTPATIGYTTRLISPVMDLSMGKVFQPILVFSHAQQQRTGDFDQLKVYYRSQVTDAWVRLDGRNGNHEFNQKIAKWQRDTIQLTSQSETYQIMFEVTDRFGRGVVLDNIEVRPMPTCLDPYGYVVSGLTTSAATVSWNASFDTDSFEVALTTAALDPSEEVDPSKIIYNGFLTDDEFSFSSEKAGLVLKRNQSYWLYVRSYCQGATSEWTYTSFRTKNFVNLPLVQDFTAGKDFEYKSGSLNHINYWSFGTSIKREDGVTMEFMPFVNTNTQPGTASAGYYAYDQSFCLAFTGARSLDTNIPAGQYVYAATPELNVESLSNVFVSFWGTAYQSVGDNFASGIIVGVMTDPEDFSTFVPIDTCYVKEDRVHKKFGVSLAQYAGEGKYLAFASDFKDKDNRFYIDNILIKESNAPVWPSDIKISNATANSFTLSLNSNGNAYNVVVAKHKADSKGFVIMNPDSLDANDIIVKLENQTEQEIKIAVEAAFGTLLEVYVQAVNAAGAGEWALPVATYLPLYLATDDLPFKVDWEETTNTHTERSLNQFGSSGTTTAWPQGIISMTLYAPNGHGLNSSYPMITQLYSSSNMSTSMEKKVNSHYLWMKKEYNEVTKGDPDYYGYRHKYGNYIALPQVEDLSKVLLKFYMERYSSSIENSARVGVGILTDPYDITTFDTIAVFDCNSPSEYQPFSCSFENYKGNGKIIAILAMDAQNPISGGRASGSGYELNSWYASEQRIDWIQLFPLGECNPISNPKVETAHDSVVLSWGANNMTKWQLRVKNSKDSLLVDSLVEQTSFIVRNLNPHSDYTYMISPVCDSLYEISDWLSFTTECLPANPLPLVEDFEDPDYKTGSSVKFIPYCWSAPSYTYTEEHASSPNYYPYISRSTTANWGHNSNSMYALYTNTSSTAQNQIWTALPVMADSIKKLQVEFYVKGYSVSQNSMLQIGVMTDPNDITTFEVVDSVNVVGTAWKGVIVTFDKYAGEGKYIAFKRNYERDGKVHYYLDDITVDYIKDCEKLFSLTASEPKTNGVTLSWNKTNADAYEVMVLSQSINANADDTTGLVISVETTTENTLIYVNDKLALNTNYYAYVRTVCGSTKTTWSDVVAFKTTCEPETPEAMGTIMFHEQNILGCWSTGVMNGETTSNVPKTAGSKTSKFGYYLYIFNVAATDGAYAIMPPLDVTDINKYQISFDICTNSTIATNKKQMTVGIISNPADLSTFAPLTTVHFPYAVDSLGYMRVTIPFDSYDGDPVTGAKGTQVMFLSESGDSTNYAYIDNVRFDLIPGCAAPSEVIADSVGTYGAKIAWNKTGEKYEVAITETKVAPSETNAKVIWQKETTDTFAIATDTLQMLTTYYMYVRTICGVGDTSAWSNARSFTTICPDAYKLPFAEDFEKSANTGASYKPDCWTYYYVNGATVTEGKTTSYPSISGASYSHSSKYCMYMYSSNATTKIYSFAATPYIDTELNKAMVSFWYKANAYAAATPSRKLVVGVAEEVSTLDTLMATLSVLDTIVQTNTSSTIPYEKYSRIVSEKYNGKGHYIVLISIEGNGTTSTGGMYVDDIEISLVPSCFLPDNLSAAKMYDTSAQLTWEQLQGDNTAWDVAYGTEGTDVKDMTIVAADTTAFIVNGLQPSTTYDFYVRANCGDETSDWRGPVTATTLYQIPLADAKWTFENGEPYKAQAPTGSYRIPQTWFVNNSIKGLNTVGEVPYIYYNTKNATTGLNSYVRAYSGDSVMYFYAGTSATIGSSAPYAVLPVINDVENYDSLQIRFMARVTYSYTPSKVDGSDSIMYTTYCYDGGSYSRMIRVGTVTDPYDMSTFEELTQYIFPTLGTSTSNVDINKFPDPEGTNYWREVVVPFYGAKGKYIVLAGPEKSNTVFIDDIIVEKVDPNACANVTKLTLDEESLKYNYAEFSWLSPKKNFKVTVTEKGKAEAYASAVIDTAFFAIDTLQAQTSYTISVQAVCGEDLSKAVTLEFTTPCIPTEKDEASWGFVDNLYQWGTSATYVIPECWDEGLGFGSGASYTPYAIINPNAAASSICFSRGDTVGGRALQFYTTASYYNAYAVLPELNFELDSMTLHFWGRAARFNSSRATTPANKGKLNAANGNYARALVIGVMTDPANFETFTPIDTITYDQKWTSNAGVFAYNDPLGNNYWQEYALPLAKYQGKGRITIVAPNPKDFSTASSPTSYFFVDDLEIIKGDFCTPATGQRAENVTATSATIRWTDLVINPYVQLQVATSEEFEDKSLIFNQKLDSTNMVVLNNLKPATAYFFRIKHLCDTVAGDESEWSAAGTFITDYVIRFSENFNAVKTNLPKNWWRSNTATAEEVFSGEKTLSEASETASYDWRVNVGSNQQIYANLTTNNASSSSTSSSKHWLISPEIDLSANTEDSLLLSFDIALRAQSSDIPNPNTDLLEQFMVIVSTDGAKTWKAEDAIIWSTDIEGEYNFNGFYANGKFLTKYIDLSKYAGQTINLAFYIYSFADKQVAGSKNIVLLDNIQLNTYKLTENSDQICRWEDYSGHGFYIDADQLPAGINQFERFTPAQKDNVDDLIERLTITVEDESVNELESVVLCEGDTYKGYGFEFIAVESCVYKQKLQSGIGCDSTVILNVTVNKKQYENVEATICQGSYYEFNGVKYYTNTIQSDTLPAANGCDSIVTLYLTVNPILEGETLVVNRCPDDPAYYFTEKYPALTEDGIYTDTVQNNDGCDSIASVQIINREEAYTFFRAAICQGEVYDVYPFGGLRNPGDYSTPGGEQGLHTIYGCDSIVTLHLLVATPTDEQTFMLEDSIAVNNLPYVLNDVEILPLGTEVGVYTRTINLNCGEANLVITVGYPQSINNTFVNSLAVMPNPAQVGEPIRILGSFDDATVEVTSATGALVYTAQNLINPITIPGMPVAGVYLIRLRENGRIYQAKLMVK